MKVRREKHDSITTPKKCNCARSAMVAFERICARSAMLAFECNLGHLGWTLSREKT